MNKQTNLATAFGKKSYAKPQVKGYQVKASSIICTSPNQVKPSNEEYEVESTSSWF